MTDVVISEFTAPAAVERLSAHARVHYDPTLFEKPDLLAEFAAQARALVVRNRTQVRGGLLEGAAKLVCIGRQGVGLDNIDMAACARRGVTVYPATGANALAVAEYAVTAVLMLLRGAYQGSDRVASGTWPRPAFIGRETAGKTLGIVGLGDIGRQTARRAAALGMEAVACDPYLDDADPAWALARRVSLGELLSVADAVSLHVPLTAETRHLIGPDQFAAMRPGAVIVNTARGGVVDEAALVEAMASGGLGGAALDVYETEPLTAAAAARFGGLKNLILTPHVAGLTVESEVRVSTMVVDKVISHLAGLA
ncbi:MAG TPA: hydroxyacid dehydrogenase [Thermohalobaculum sp.]|nr:hydroxyacid dehydrogenase [Thermohalobaculum sp.]